MTRANHVLSDAKTDPYHRAISAAMKYPTSTRPLMVSLFISALFFTACSDDQVEDNNGTKQCLFGDEPHPITGLCPEEVLDPVDDEDQGMTSDPVMEDMATTCPVGEVWDATQQRCFPETSPSLDMAVDAAPDDADMGPQPVDMADWTDATMEERRCMAGVDDDADGLDNDCECLYGTEPYIADTDGDGLSDGEEDVNKFKSTHNATLVESEGISKQSVWYCAAHCGQFVVFFNDK